MKLRRPTKETTYELWSQGLKVTEIVQQTGLHRATVSRHLTEMGVPLVGRGGPSRKAVCQRGHDMAEHGVEIAKEKGGGRYCRACDLDRKRGDYFNKQLMKAINEI